MTVCSVLAAQIDYLFANWELPWRVVTYLHFVVAVVVVVAAARLVLGWLHMVRYL